MPSLHLSSKSTRISFTTAAERSRPGAVGRTRASALGANPGLWAARSQSCDIISFWTGLNASMPSKSS